MEDYRGKSRQMDGEMKVEGVKSGSSGGKSLGEVIAKTLALLENDVIVR